MKKIISTPLIALVLFNFFFCTGCTTSTKNRNPQSTYNYEVTNLTYDTKILGIGKVNLRTAVFDESAGSEFKGCVIYLQGLADSIMNHKPLFETLAQNGYRTIAFDYMGQGGSGGSMNHTRLLDVVAPTLEIGQQARFVWNHYSQVKGANGQTCANSKKMVIGWSTGGLAAYRLAQESWAHAVVLLAPGIHPHTLVGEAAEEPKLLAKGEQIITERTLTRNTFANELNPHVDPIKPTTPIAVPLFAANLVVTSKISQLWQIPSGVKGHVFLGTGDTYVDYEQTEITLTYRAPQFAVSTYQGALHEIDNEVSEVAADIRSKTIQLFNSIN